MRPLVVDDEARAKVARVLAHAEANPYRPDASKKPPGDDPRFVAHLDTYRAVFTFTHSDGTVYRHLSVSVPGKDYPNPAAVFVIADLFGFTGWDQRTIDRVPDDWMMDVNDAEHCVVVAQKCQATH